MSRVGSFMAAGTAVAILASGCTGGETVSPALPEESASVVTESGDRCHIDMGAILDGLVIRDVVGAQEGGTDCNAGETILPGQVSTSYGDILEQERGEWEALLDEVESLVENEEGQRTPIGETFTRVVRVGWLTTYNGEPKALLNGSPDSDHPGSRTFGPEECSLDGTNETGSHVEIESLGEVAKYEVAVVYSDDREPGSSRCIQGDIVLIDPKLAGA